MSSLYVEAMQSCAVQNGQLIFANNYSAVDLLQIYNELSKDLLGRNIPNYRPVAFTQIPFSRDFVDFPTESNPIFYGTKYDWGENLSRMCCADIYTPGLDVWGYISKDECDEYKDTRFGTIFGFDGCNSRFMANPDMTAVYEDDPNLPNPERYESKDKVKAATGREILKESGKNFRLVALPNEDTEIIGEYVHEERRLKIYTDCYKTQGHKLVGRRSNPRCNKDTLEPVEYLVPHAYLHDYNHEYNNYVSQQRPVFVHFFILLRRGTGFRKDSDNRMLFVDSVNEFWIPTYTDYGLSKFFTIGYPTQAGNSLRLVYHDTLNEKVVNDILVAYGKEL